MFARALFAFLALPGTVAFLIPLLIAPGGANRFVRSAGLLPLVVGTALLLWCVREFYVAGHGIGVAIAFHLRVRLHEEPFLTRTHGPEWERYKERVPRWLWRARRRG